MPVMVSPTGLGFRSDPGGDGHYGARRRRGDKVYAHTGVDWSCVAGQEVVAPHHGTIIRHARPYAADLSYNGVLLEGTLITSKLFYLLTQEDLIGQDVRQGMVIGIAQAISEKYPDSGVTDHVHQEIVRCDPMLLMEVLHGRGDTA